MAGVGESDGLLTSTVRPIVLLRIVHFPPFASELSRSPRRRQAGGRRHPLRCATNRQEASRCSVSALSLKQTDGHSLNTLRPSTLHTSLSWAGFSKIFVLGSLVALRDLEDARARSTGAPGPGVTPPRGVSRPRHSRRSRCARDLQPSRLHRLVLASLLRCTGSVVAPQDVPLYLGNTIENRKPSRKSKDRRCRANGNLWRKKKGPVGRFPYTIQRMEMERRVEKSEVEHGATNTTPP